MKPFMHQVTIDKVRVYGFNKDEWKAALLNEIDPDQLPAYYGGTLTDPDGNPKCPSKVFQIIKLRYEFFAPTFNQMDSLTWEAKYHDPTTTPIANQCQKQECNPLKSVAVVKRNWNSTSVPLIQF